MNFDTVEHLINDIEARYDIAGGPGEALELLIETTQVLARHTAELVFLKLQTEPGWTPDEARGLSEKALDMHAKAIAEAVHAQGGSLDLALQLSDAAFEAFRSRLVELAISQGDGGAA